MIHPTLSELVAETLEILHDGSFSSGNKIRTLINRGYFQICSDVRLPDLYTVATVDTVLDQSKADMPADFMWGLDYAFNRSINRHCRIATFPNVLYNRWQEKEGSVVDVATDGAYLHYQRVPKTVETIEIHYQARPEVLELDTDQPSFLPAHLAGPLLTQYAAAHAYELIEDGVDGQKINTQYYLAQFQVSLLNLKRFIGPNDRGFDGFAA